MDVTLTTPALLFPALSLLLLAYTNRFLALASLIRSLHEAYQQRRELVLMAQIENLRGRVVLIRDMQATGMASLFLCVASMLTILAGQPGVGRWIFGASLGLLLLSLGISLREVMISVGAINLHLTDLERTSLPGSVGPAPRSDPRG